MNFKKKLNNLIPGGCHTYSRGSDQFPFGTPEILISGKGAYVYDKNRNKYLDYGMGLRSVGIGYANKRINQAAIDAIKKGNNLTRASLIELEAANQIIKTIPSFQMVKFAKNGSNVTTAALKLARAFTKKEYICVPEEQPFFSFDDWFIGSTNIKKGIPEKHYRYTLKFNFKNLETLQKHFIKFKDNIAAVILEPVSANISPCFINCAKLSEKNICKKCPKNKKNILSQIRKICSQNNTLLIFDEMITGFRWSMKGAQDYFGVMPDLSTFGKAIANGFSVSALGGRRDIMELGGIKEKRMERVFLLSSTHGAEMSSLAAMIENIKYYKENNVCKHLWNYGENFKTEANIVSRKLGLAEFFYISGDAVSLTLNTLDKHYKPCNIFKTLFQQQMLKSNIIIPWISQSFSHKDRELDLTLKALKNTLLTYSKALKKTPNYFVQGPIVKPVFRKYN
jgi:glutamate-1-semialdehyde 2,1-aminomutase